SVVRSLGGTPAASVIHQEWRTDVARAALANGVLIGAFECEPLTGSHASGTVLPAVLAVAQQEHFDGAAFLTALALGFEVSALLARPGVPGPATVLEGRSCYFNAFSTPPRMERLVEKLGADWAIEPPSLKSYATHVTQQAVVQAIQDLKREHPLDATKITRVVIRGAPRIMEERHTERAPQDVLGGQYSLPFTTAVALTRDMSN